MFLNYLMKLERNTERKYSMQVMSTTITTTTTKLTTKWKFRFTRGFMLVLGLKGFYGGVSNILDIFKCPQCHFYIINFCGVIQSCKPLDTN